MFISIIVVNRQNIFVELYLRKETIGIIVICGNRFDFIDIRFVFSVRVIDYYICVSTSANT